jgi:hypothetical protein
VDAFDDRHEAIAELERDGHSMLLRALDRDDGTPVLVRRLVRSRRFDVDVRAGLVAEAEYCARLACSRCPEAETVTLEDGELVLEYKGADGVELDRVLNALEASGRVLTPAAAVALVSEVLHNAEAIARIKPPAVEAEVWGHGEIAPRSVMLGRDGFGRLYEARLATSGFRSLSSPGSTLCRAPELAGGVLFGTPSSDVYAVGALVSLALFGQAPLAGASSEPLAVVLARAAVASPGVVPDALLQVLLTALAASPADRYPGPEVLREALRTAMPLDLAGWRATAEGLASLARTMAADRRLERVPEPLFTAHPELARPSGHRGNIADEVAAFAQDQALTASQAVAALSPLGDARVTPRRGNALPKRIAVVPRRVSRAVADAFDLPLETGDLGAMVHTGDVPPRRSSDPQGELPARAAELSSDRAPPDRTPERGMRALEVTRPGSVPSERPRMSPVPGDRPRTSVPGERVGLGERISSPNLPVVSERISVSDRVSSPGLPAPASTPVPQPLPRAGLSSSPQLPVLSMPTPGERVPPPRAASSDRLALGRVGVERAPSGDRIPLPRSVSSDRISVSDRVSVPGVPESARNRGASAPPEGGVTVSGGFASAAHSPVGELTPSGGWTPLAELPARPEETLLVDEAEAARAVEDERISGEFDVPRLEVVPSDPAPARPMLEIVPSNPAPATVRPSAAVRADHDDDGVPWGAVGLTTLVVGALLAYAVLLAH